MVINRLNSAAKGVINFSVDSGKRYMESFQFDISKNILNAQWDGKIVASDSMNEICWSSAGVWDLDEISFLYFTKTTTTGALHKESVSITFKDQLICFKGIDQGREKSYHFRQPLLIQDQCSVSPSIIQLMLCMHLKNKVATYSLSTSTHIVSRSYVIAADSTKLLFNVLNKTIVELVPIDTDKWNLKAFDSAYTGTFEVIQK